MPLDLVDLTNMVFKSEISQLSTLLAIIDKMASQLMNFVVLSIVEVSMNKIHVTL